MRDVSRLGMKERTCVPAALGSREQRRIVARRERMRMRWRQRRQRGQTLIIFALSLTVLIGIAGLAVDVTRLYDLYARMQRAAEAGALAGVLYLPNYYGTPLPAPGDGHTAISRASIEVVKNGFGSVIADSVTTDCPNPVTSVTIAVCQATSGTTGTGSGTPFQLEVTVTQTISVALLGGLGVAPTRISASGQAAYLPPAALGINTSQPNYFGDQGECGGASPTNCNPTGNGAHNQNFMANITGPGDLKEEGDPFVYCEEGTSQGPPADQNLSGATLPYLTYNGVGTNHLPYPDLTTGTPSQLLSQLTQNHCGQPDPSGTPAGNPDQQPPGYDGPMTDGTAHPGAYNYGITIPQSDDGSSLWIDNGNFVPHLESSNNCHGKQSLDTFYKAPSSTCTSFYPNYGCLNPNPTCQSFNGKFDDPSFYFNTTFTLYKVTSLYFRNLDRIVTCGGGVTCPNSSTGVTQTANLVEYTFRPYDQMSVDTQYHGCPSINSTPPTYDLSDNSSYSGKGITPGGPSCVSAPPCQIQWCNIASHLPAGTYRLAVEATTYSQQSGTTLLSGWGQHGYGVKLCGQGTTNFGINGGVGCASNSDIAAWNNMDIIFSFPSANTNNTIPLVEVPYTYAGRSVTISLFDLCDSLVGNNCWAELIPPTTASDTGTPNPTITVNYPSWVRTGTDPCSGKNSIYGANSGDNIYNGLWINTTIQLPANYQGGVWQLNVCTSQGTAQDVVGLKFTLVGSAVFLVPPK